MAASPRVVINHRMAALREGRLFPLVTLARETFAERFGKTEEVHRRPRGRKCAIHLHAFLFRHDYAKRPACGAGSENVFTISMRSAPQQANATGFAGRVRAARSTIVLPSGSVRELPTIARSALSLPARVEIPRQRTVDRPLQTQRTAIARCPPTR
jgi:hypothetical protein